MTGPKWRRYLRFWGANVEGDVDDELRFHLEMREADYRRRGLDSEAAHAAARERFGNYHDVAARLREHDRRKVRQQRRVEMFADLMQDVRYGARALRRNWGLTIAVVAVLALGVGANTAMFSVVDAVFLRPLPFANPERLVALEHVSVPFGADAPHAQAYVSDILVERDVFAGAAAYGIGGGNIAGGADPVRAKVGMVSPSLFPLLGVRALVGRGFTDEEAQTGAPNVTILSYGLWQRSFGGDPEVLGRKLVLNGRSYEIVGVMPPRFAFPEGAELWVPMVVPLDFARLDIFRTVLGIRVVARLAPGVSIDAAHARVRALNDAAYERLRASNDSRVRPDRQPPKPDDREAVPLRDVLIGRNARAPLLVLLGAVAFVLLVACANVSNLLLTRAAARRREIAVRAALGAGRWRIVRQLLTESVLLALAGGVAGVAVAAGSIGLFAKLAPERVVSIAPVQLDWRVLAFTLAATVATGILFGLAPAISAARGDVNEPLKSGGLSGSTARSSRLRATLVVAEVALALVLVTGAGLMLKSFGKLVGTDVGIRIENVVMGKVTLPQARYEKQEQRLDFYQRVLARLAADPAVASSGVSMAIPLTTEGNVGFTLRVDGAERDLAGGGANAGWMKDIEMLIDGQIFASVLSVSPGYLRTLGIPVLRGRDLLPSDRAGSRVAVVNERFAKAFWPTTGALGKRVYPFGDTIPYTIVGIVGDVRNYSLQNKPGLVIYRSIAESAPSYATFVARGDGDPRALVARIRDAVWSVDRQQAVFELEPVSNVVAESVAPQRTSTTLITLFGAIALLLSAVGVYAVIAFGVSQRTREIGIRIALGAGSRQVVRLVLREGLVLALVGAAIGAAGAFALTRLMKSLLYEVSAADPLVFAGSTALLVGVALVAALVPARRAARVDPVTAIRTE